MPDARLQRTRATLPNGYQFGDACPSVDRMMWLFVERNPSLVDAWAQYRSCRDRWNDVARSSNADAGWNDIERGEH